MKARLKNSAAPPRVPQNSAHGQNTPALIALPVREVALDQIDYPSRQVRRYSERQIAAIERSVARFGPRRPILCTAQHEVIEGGAYVEALRRLGYERVPAIIVDDLSASEIETLKIALARTAELGAWDQEALCAAIGEILDDEPDLARFTGFDMAEIDAMTSAIGVGAGADGAIEISDGTPTSRLGDLYEFAGGHCIFCGDAKDPQAYRRLLRGRRATLAAIDPPYGVIRIEGFASSKHRDFVEGSGLTEEESFVFFCDFLTPMAGHLEEGSLVYLFIDYRGMFALQRAIREVGLEQKSLCVWDKENPGMGSPYRHQAEFVIVAKCGQGKSIDNVKLGRYGRNRSTVWRTPGMAGFGRGRAKALADHPTPKPVGLIADILLDSSNRGDAVLDPFLGSGTTLVAAHRVGRIGFGIELDPRYVDCAVKRMEQITGAPARHLESGMSFAELAEHRRSEFSIEFEFPIAHAISTPHAPTDGC